MMIRNAVGALFLLALPVFTIADDRDFIKLPSEARQFFAGTAEGNGGVDNDFLGIRWAVLLAGSTGYWNYRHQADVCHAYQTLRRGGLNDENIVIFMYDDIAYNEENPRPGVIINSPHGEDVYKGVPKDYVGDDVTVHNFFAVLLGNKTAVRGGGMRGHSNGVRGLVFPDRGDRQGSATSNKNNQRHYINGNHNSNHHNVRHHGGGAGSGSSDTAHGGKKGGSLSGGDAIAAVWAPNLMIALTNKEKEEDFWAIKGSKLPQRPKKRAKFIQRTLNLVSPGAWLCDLTLDRYEVREKKATKKRPRGLKAMGNMVSDSE